jgi:uncharacterized membrane protein YhiD involved in acid resistance
MKRARRSEPPSRVTAVDDLIMFGHIALGAGFGFAIGWEREVRGHPAGSVD